MTARGKFVGRCVLFAIGIGASTALGQSSDKSILRFSGDNPTAVRLFSHPGPRSNNYFHPPLIFRVVKIGDAWLNTAPMHSDGRTAFITSVEMDQLIRRLADSNVSWQITPEVIPFKPPSDLEPTEDLDVTITASGGTADTVIQSKNICPFLAGLDSAFTTPRALWENQLFRFNLYCDVSGFDPKKFPDHDYK